MFNKLRHSFSGRLSFYILLFAASVFVAAFSVFYFFSSRSMEQNARIQSENVLHIINLQIEKVLRRVEAIPDNLNWVIANGNIQSDSMYSVTQNVVRNNPDIYGSAIAFEPYYFEDKGYYFSPYSYRDGDTIRSLQLGNKDYDYFTWEWYSKPKELGKPCWSEPYYDEGGGQMVMCTYSAPIYARDGEMIGIFTSDISLEWLTDMIDSMKRSDQSYTFMLGKDGTYIVHYLRERILHQTIFGATEDMTDPKVKLLGDNMIAGKQGMEVLDNDGVKSYVFYAPVSRTLWSVGIVLPSNEVFGDLHRINLQMLLIVGIGLIALFLICSKIINNQTRPLKKFAVSAREIAHGDFNVRLPVIYSKDEMGELFDSFAYMQSELTDYMSNLQLATLAKEKIESELRIAREIQMSMIPKVFPPFPMRNEIDLYSVLQPAKEVGGDLYDFFIDGDQLYFAIGDVSGKGVPASLLMAVTLSLFRSVAVGMENPAEVMRSLNNSIAENNTSNMFVTLLIGTLDLKTGRLNYCNAGHNPPLLITSESGCNWLKLTPNLPVGVMKGFAYREQALDLSDLSVLVLYTDGVTEAENGEKELYGEKRLLNVIRRNAESSPRIIIESVLSDVHQHVKDNEPSDDITLLAISFDRKITSTLVICNKIEELAKVSEFITQISEQMNLPDALILNLNLVLEEAVSNVIFHAYKEYPESEQIEIIASCKDGDLTFRITDNGKEFDPTNCTEPDLTLSAEDRPIGGLGVYLIKKIMDEVIYQRINNKNILLLTKNSTYY